MKNEKLIKIGLIFLNLLLFFLLFPYLTKIINVVFKLLFPFLIGFTLAFLLLPIVNWLVKKKIKRNYAVGITVLLFFCFISGIIIIFIPIIVKEVDFLIKNIPNYMNSLSDFINNIKLELSFLPSELVPNVDIIEMKMSNFLISMISNMFNFFTNFVSFIITFLMSIILMIYFLLDFEKISLVIKEKASKYKKVDLIEYFRNIKETIQAYFKGVFLVSSIVFILSFILFKIIGLEYALLLGLIVGITDIIPYIGPYIGGFIVSLIAISDSLKKMVIVLIIIVIIQGLESWFITPKVQSKKISVNPILVLLFLVIFGKIMGILGLVIAVPILAILQTTLKTKYNK